MPYPREHMLMVVNGTLGTDRTAPFERFSFGIRFIPGNTLPMAALDNDEVGKGLAASFQQRWRNPLGGVTDMAQLESMKWNRIGTDGKYVNDTSREIGFDPAVGFGGQNRTSYLPPQCSLAITLRTGKTRGLARWGRFYLPAPGFQVDNNTGQISTTDRVGAANVWGSWLDGLTTQLGGTTVGMIPVVMSRGRNGTGPGAFNPVTAVEVGGVIDTMRSRRASIAENYAVHQFGNV